MRHYDIGYFSSSDRGLECLLELLPKIQERLGRDVTTVWAYGWDTFDQMHSKDPVKMKWKWNMIKTMNQRGMENKGRLSHEELAKLMQDTKVWAYPTEFTEIHCITALKAQEAGCIPVTSGCYALKETVGIEEDEVLDIYSNKKAQDKYISRTVKALTDGGVNKAVPNRYWTDVAKVWDKALK